MPDGGGLCQSNDSPYLVHTLINSLLTVQGYDPALELAVHVHKRSQNDDGTDPITYLDGEQIRRKEQSRVDEIVSGTELGHYFLLIGPKGVGKSTMLLEAMRAVGQ